MSDNLIVILPSSNDKILWKVESQTRFDFEFDDHPYYMVLSCGSPEFFPYEDDDKGVLYVRGSHVDNNDAICTCYVKPSTRLDELDKIIGAFKLAGFEVKIL